ncbi:hypothetical protein [Sphingomonas xanthus]|uniref:hypothetical protein n=1 Tax=Sphingomonas xanthus TaxID=2594473 RepID=UPI00164D2E2C|nr:hypothetical protein [Sphingomonas xanthus]
MRSRLALIAAVPALAGLASCAPVDPGFGEALRYDMAAQTIDPDPVYPEDGAQPGSNGEKAAAATEKYRKGETKQLRIERTGQGVSSGSGSGTSGPQ